MLVYVDQTFPLNSVWYAATVIFYVLPKFWFSTVPWISCLFINAF